MPVSMTYNGITYYLTYDQVGSLKVVTDSSGTIVKKMDYDSYGTILSDSNPSFTIPFGFAGGLHDRDTNLIRFGARDYDPTLGRWTAKDPIDFNGGDTNLYGYVQNNPVNFVDPVGLVNWGQIVGGSIGVVGGAISIGAGTAGIAIGIAEMSAGPAGIFLGIHTIGIGGTLFGAGAMSGWVGFQNIWKGLKNNKRRPCK